MGLKEDLETVENIKKDTEKKVKEQMSEEQAKKFNSFFILMLILVAVTFFILGIYLDKMYNIPLYGITVSTSEQETQESESDDISSENPPTENILDDTPYSEAEDVDYADQNAFDEAIYSETADLINITPPMEGYVISCAEGSIPIHTTDYISLYSETEPCNDLLCGSKIKITRMCYSREHKWYEAYDPDSDEYFGWIDSDYIYEYE